ncbi:uncharacterized protein LOC111110586 isoform X5 [Crassostrea virginica]
MMGTMSAPSSYQHSWMANQNIVIGSCSLRQEYQNAVRKSFAYLRKHLTFESLRDKLVEKNLLSDRERDDYVCMIPLEYAMIGKVIKLMIKKGRCMDFVDIIDNLPDHRHVMNKINAARQLGNNQGQQVNTCTQPCFEVTDMLLKRHFGSLFLLLEPLDIADEMFQAGHISDDEHDSVTNSSRRYERLEGLLAILSGNAELYPHFVNAAQSLGYSSVLDTLKKGVPFKFETSESALWIQRNFTYLQEELPSFDFLLTMLGESLDSIDNYDMYGLSGAMRKTAKLLKILLRKGPEPCNDLMGKIKSGLGREDMIDKMKERSIYLKIRGFPRLDTALQSLNVSCLQEHQQLLKNELDPLYLSDLLFEERAIELFEHDKVTEESRCNKQTPLLLGIVNENKNECFHFFLHILLNRDYKHIIKKIVEPVEESVQNDSRRNERRISHNITKMPDDVENKPVELQLSVESSPSENERLTEEFRASASEIMENAISHGEMYVDDIKPGSVVLQLRPVTEQAANKLLNAKENNRLLEMVLEMLEHTDIEKRVDVSKPLKIKVQVWYASSTKPKPDDHRSVTSQIKEHIKTCRKMLISKLEPLKLASFLSSSAYFSQSEIDRINASPSRSGRVLNLLSFIESGDSEVVKDFVSALTDAGFSDLAKLLDPIYFHNKAENIRTVISSNYKSFLEEMQLSIATEILSECIGDVRHVKTKILPKNGIRRKRMNTFLQFILQEDYNVIVFEEMLKSGGLEELFVLGECKNVKNTKITGDVEVKVVMDEIPGTGTDKVLFESVITISYPESLCAIDEGNKSDESQEKQIDVNTELVQRLGLADNSAEEHEDMRPAMKAMEDEIKNLRVQLTKTQKEKTQKENMIARMNKGLVKRDAVMEQHEREKMLMKEQLRQKEEEIRKLKDLYLEKSFITDEADIEDIVHVDDSRRFPKPFITQRETETNSGRLNQLFVTICEDVFRLVLNCHIKPENLRLELDTNKPNIDRILNAEQRKLLYPTSGGKLICSRDLDFSLAYILLQNICNIPPHQKGWGVPPNHEDSSLAACIDRINIRKKSFVEYIEYSWKFIGDYQFLEIWNEIRKDVLEIEKQFFGTFIFERYMENIYDRDFKTSKTQKRIKERQQDINRMIKQKTGFEEKTGFGEKEGGIVRSWREQKAGFEEKEPVKSVYGRHRISTYPSSDEEEEQDINRMIKQKTGFEEKTGFGEKGGIVRSWREQKAGFEEKEPVKSVYGRHRISTYPSSDEEEEQDINRMIKQKTGFEEKTGFGEKEGGIVRSWREQKAGFEEKELVKSVYGRHRISIYPSRDEEEEQDINRMIKQKTGFEEKTGFGEKEGGIVRSWREQKTGFEEKEPVKSVYGRHRISTYPSSDEEEEQGRGSFYSWIKRKLGFQEKAMKSMPSLLSERSTIYISNVHNIRHISAMSEHRIWVSDYCFLQQVDDKGKVIREIKNISRDFQSSGKHSVTLSGDFIYIENKWDFIKGMENHVNTLKTDGSTVTLYSTDMMIGCLYSSPINGDILIGVTNLCHSYLRNTEGVKVIRCDSTGKKIQEIEFKHQDQTERLYEAPGYITENRINGDILVSDFMKDALVVVDKSGRHRFDYRGGFSSAENFLPRAVCTDVKGRILFLHRRDGTYRNNENCISLLDQDGNFISRLLEYGIDNCDFSALCVDDENNMYIGLKNVIHVYKLSDSP